MLTLAFADQDLSVSELSQRIGLSLATTSQLVGELSRAGLLERSEDERDRRRTLVRVPDAYRPHIQAMLEDHMAPMQRTLERLSPRAREHFLEGFRILRDEVAPPAGD
jgi:DNA-binding MarR family transcriptional regulator